jgi:predicted DNA-binding protein YlxM (UPF0122 family)
MADLAVFDSPDTRMPRRPLLPISRIRDSTIRVDATEFLNNEQRAVFDNIEKIKRSTQHFNSKISMYREKELAGFLRLFGNYPRTLKKEGIVDELVKLYNKYDYENQREKPVDVDVTSNDDDDLFL